jgi:hypothetical protein
LPTRFFAANPPVAASTSSYENSFMATPSAAMAAGVACCSNWKRGLGARTRS